MPVITGKKVGDVVKFQVVRDGLPKTFSVTLKANPNIKLTAVIDDNATAKQLAVRKRWAGI